MTLENPLRKADQLDAITQRVGSALWQLQELEGATAQYFVLVAQATLGMGHEAGQSLLDKAQNKTFGSTVTQLAKAKLLPQELEARFKALLVERNWLVHSSRASNRNAVHDDSACDSLLERLNLIAEEARLLLKQVVKQVEVYANGSGISPAKIDALASEILKQWHGNDAI